ncbi:3194_t:CDS:2 [Racocetra persica]|uniref:3194_t:CDS:1 n=1 Tax=Racocetra persica TaxID=160502 RepID=A0ACA9LMN1_9GLOM|nr:3194_t:CDS:2 [Racocetra persica]
MTQGKFWAVLCILDERIIDGNSYYLIQWKGNDKNGNPWTPTWEPGENCTQSLINDWKMRKLETKQDYRCHRENSVISDSTVTDGSDQRCSDVLTLWDEISIKGSNNPSESSIVDQDIYDNSIIHDSQQPLKRSQTECQSENSVGEEEIIHHANKKNRTQESFISKEFTSDKDNNCSYQESFAQQTGSFEIESCISQTPLSPQCIPTQSSVSTEQTDNDLNNKKMLPNLPSHCQPQISHESLQTFSSLASNGAECTSASSDLNSDLLLKDPVLLTKELQNKDDTIAIMDEERDRLQQTMSQIKRNWQLQQEKAISLSKENEQIKQQLQQKTKDYENIRFQYLFYQQTIQQLQELCKCHSEKDIQHSLELEESKRKYEIIRQNDIKVIEELERSTKIVIAENQKLKQELENIKSFNASMENMNKSSQNLMVLGKQDLLIEDSSLSNNEKTGLSSNKLKQPSIVKLGLDYETLLSENKRLESDIKTLNLQNMLQQQDLKLMEEKLLQNDSTLRFFMDLQQVNKVGK